MIHQRKSLLFFQNAPQNSNNLRNNYPLLIISVQHHSYQPFRLLIERMRSQQVCSIKMHMEQILILRKKYLITRRTKLTQFIYQQILLIQRNIHQIYENQAQGINVNTLMPNPQLILGTGVKSISVAAFQRIHKSNSSSGLCYQNVSRMNVPMNLTLSVVFLQLLENIEHQDQSVSWPQVTIPDKSANISSEIRQDLSLRGQHFAFEPLIVWRSFFLLIISDGFGLFGGLLHSMKHH